jgi:hypothetical protein
MLMHQTLSFVRYSPDGLALTPDGQVLLIEVKCPYTREIKPDVVPPEYYDQIQLGLLVLESFGLETECDFIQFKPLERNNNPEILSIRRVVLDKEWQNLTIVKAKLYNVQIELDKQKYKDGTLKLENVDKENPFDNTNEDNLI